MLEHAMPTHPTDLEGDSPVKFIRKITPLVDERFVPQTRVADAAANTQPHQNGAARSETMNTPSSATPTAMGKRASPPCVPINGIDR